MSRGGGEEDFQFVAVGGETPPFPPYGRDDVAVAVVGLAVETRADDCAFERVVWSCDVRGDEGDDGREAFWARAGGFGFGFVGYRDDVFP